MTDADNIRSPLTDYENNIVTRGRAMEPANPPEPWGNLIVISAAGVFAAGWDIRENILLISSDGYSISDTLTGERLVRDRNQERAFAAISADQMHFKIPETQEQIHIFGINAGDGIHVTQDGWELEVIQPWWPRDAVIIRTPFIPGSGYQHYLDRAYMLQLHRLDGLLKCGFSPSGKRFAIVGSRGAECYSRS